MIVKCPKCKSESTDTIESYRIDDRETWSYTDLNTDKCCDCGHTFKYTSICSAFGGSFGHYVNSSMDECYEAVQGMSP